MNTDLRLFEQETIEDIMSRMTGRLCLESSNCNYLAWGVSKARSGHHLEIGTLHGGSAVLAALVKVQMGFSGDVWCVDPLNGYYIGTRFEYPVDYVSKVPVNPEVVKQNLETFGVADRVHIVQAVSNPLPAGLPDVFSSVYIDGDHWGDGPLNDWKNVKDITTGYVIFDNVDSATHPDVVRAVEIASQDKDWEVALRAGITAVLCRKAALL